MTKDHGSNIERDRFGERAAQFGIEDRSDFGRGEPIDARGR